VREMLNSCLPRRLRTCSYNTSSELAKDCHDAQWTQAADCGILVAIDDASLAGWDAGRDSAANAGAARGCSVQIRAIGIISAATWSLRAERRARAAAARAPASSPARAPARARRVVAPGGEQIGSHSRATIGLHELPASLAQGRRQPHAVARVLAILKPNDGLLAPIGSSASELTSRRHRDPGCQLWTIDGKLVTSG
jgi:hypothetical protein